MKGGPPKNGKIALQTPRTSRLSTFYYCQVVNRALLRLLSTYILVFYRVLANYSIKLSNILYHWVLSMASFRFCETYLLHIKPFVVNKSAISSFLGGGWFFFPHKPTHLLSLIRLLLVIQPGTERICARRIKIVDFDSLFVDVNGRICLVLSLPYQPRLWGRFTMQICIRLDGRLDTAYYGLTIADVTQGSFAWRQLWKRD